MSDSSAMMRPTLAPRMRVQVDALRGEPVLLLPEGLMVLNETAYDLLRLCDGQHTVEAIVSILAHEYEEAPDALMADVLGALAEFRGRGVLG